MMTPTEMRANAERIAKSYQKMPVTDQPSAALTLVIWLATAEICERLDILTKPRERG